jgi:hypothetical protein
VQGSRRKAVGQTLHGLVLGSPPHLSGSSARGGSIAVVRALEILYVDAHDLAGVDGLHGCRKRPNFSDDLSVQKRLGLDTFTIT